MTDLELLAQIDAIEAKPSRLQSGARGAFQGLTAGHSDELLAAGRATRLLRTPKDRRTPGPRVLASMYPGLPYPEAASRWFNENRPDQGVAAEAESNRQEQEAGYRAFRGEERGKNEAASAANPGFYLGGQIAGAIPGMLATGGTAGLVAGQGALQGAGYSTSDTGAGLLGDTSLGAAGGLAGYGTGKLLGAGFQAVDRLAGRRLSAATQKAGELAQKKIEKAFASLRGTYGKAREVESRGIEVLLRAEATRALTPAQAQQLATLKASPEWTATVQEVAQNYMDDLPSALGKATTARGAMQAASQSMPADIAAEQANQLSGSMMKEQIKARLKRYGPMAVVGGFLGNALGGPGAAIVGGAAGAAVRPMLHAVRRAAEHPSVQRAVWSPVQAAARNQAGPTMSLLRSATARGALTSAVPSSEEIMSRRDPEAEAEAELQRLLNGGN